MLYQRDNLQQKLDNSDKHNDNNNNVQIFIFVGIFLKRCSYFPKFTMPPLWLVDRVICWYTLQGWPSSLNTQYKDIFIISTV